jgi:hypothetical protein
MSCDVIGLSRKRFAYAAVIEAPNAHDANVEVMFDSAAGRVQRVVLMHACRIEQAMRPP